MFNLEFLQYMLAKFNDLSILVLGDYFLDKYLYIDADKNEPSLETGLTAYQVVGRKLAPGAAGTVAGNLKALGVGNVTALGFIGKDGEGSDLISGLKAIGVITDFLVSTDEKVTPTYTKPMLQDKSGTHEINRLDIKNWTKTSEKLEYEITSRMLDIAINYDAIIVLDQVTETGCGVITPNIREVLGDMGNRANMPLIYADSRAHTGMFKNIILKCNKYEALKAVNLSMDTEPDEDTIFYCGKRISERNGKPVFITMGEKGQLVFDKDLVYNVPAIKTKGPLDICGAGDSTTAGIVCGLCCGASPEDAALLGNIIASVTIQQIGQTGTASPEQVVKRFMEAFDGTITD